VDDRFNPGPEVKLPDTRQLSDQRREAVNQLENQQTTRWGNLSEQLVGVKESGSNAGSSRQRRGARKRDVRPEPKGAIECPSDAPGCPRSVRRVMA
jgi:hypothetical protein